jgi:hypothetical protein
MKYLKSLLPAAALLTLAVPAYAQPPDEGMTVSFRLPMIVCDTKERIESITQAIHENKLEDQFTKLTHEVTAKNEPACFVSRLIGVTVGDNEDLGVATVDGLTEHFWAVHIGTAKFEGFALYEEHEKSLSIAI